LLDFFSFNSFSFILSNYNLNLGETDVILFASLISCGFYLKLAKNFYASFALFISQEAETNISVFSDY
jgi:hypothetical protein